MTYVLAIDVGTSAVRAGLIDFSGTVQRSTRRERVSHHSGVCFDAVRLWSDVCSALAGLMISPSDKISSLGIAGHIGTVFTDTDFNPLGDAGGWADSRGLEVLAEALPTCLDDLLAITGRPALAGGLLPALLDLRINSRSVFNNVRWAFSPKDYLVAKMTGIPITDHTSAAYSLASSVYDRDWSEETIRHLGLSPELFPPQYPATEVIGEVSATAAVDTGVPAGTPVVAGGPDGTLGATFTLGTNKMAIADIAGTTDVLVQLVDNPAAAPATAVLNPFTVPDVWSAGGSTGMTGGALTYWCSMLGFKGPAHVLERYAEEIRQIRAGSEGLLMQPTISGSRFPTWCPAERGGIWGMSIEHTPFHVIRAVQEGAAFVVREGVEALTAGTSSAHDPVLLAGGAAKSEFLAQLRADVLGREVITSDKTDVSLLGAGLVALVGGGVFNSISEGQSRLCGPVRHYEPDVNQTAIYDTLFAAWKDLRSATMPAASGASASSS